MGNIIMADGCTAVNGGVLIQTNERYIPVIEVLSHHFHNPNYDIICTYYYDKAIAAKVEVTLARSLKTGEWTTEIYFFANREESQHYRSYLYRLKEDKIPSKYKPIIAMLRHFHRNINFDNYVKR